MTLLPANFGAQRRGSDTAFGAESDSDARANVTIPVSAATRKPEGTVAGSYAVGVKDLSRLSVSDDGRLYWDGKPVVVRRRVQLSPWQTFGVILIGLAALMIALSGAVQVTITAHDWMCRAQWVTNYCPAPPAPPPAPPVRPDLPN
jgi:hypothetical protein